MDPSTKRTLILLSIIAAVLIVLFVITAVHKPSSGGCSKDDLTTWRNRVFSSEPVAQGQLSGCTKTLGLVTIPGRCDLQIAKADARSRQLDIRAIDALELEVHMNADDRPLTVNTEILAGDHKQFSIGKDGQTITLSCKTGSSCRAQLQ